MNPLAAFLEHPSRPAGTLRYHEVQGFLFAVSSAPELVRPSEWVPVVLGSNDEEAGFATLEEAQVILPALMALYNSVNASVVGNEPALPEDCRFKPEVLANFDDDAPIKQWSRGFLRGHQWLQDDWAEVASDDADNDLAPALVTLTFFASKELAAGYMEEMKIADMEGFASRLRAAFPTALAEYVSLGRFGHSARQAIAEPVKRAPVGRNEPCPCGSGRKYKKCHGAPT